MYFDTLNNVNFLTLKIHVNFNSAEHQKKDWKRHKTSCKSKQVAYIEKALHIATNPFQNLPTSKKEKKKDLRRAKEILTPFIAVDDMFEKAYGASGTYNAAHIYGVISVISPNYDADADMAQICVRFVQLSLSTAARLDEKLAECVAKQYGDITHFCSIIVTIIEIFVLGQGEEYDRDKEEGILADCMLALILLCQYSDPNRQLFADGGACAALWELLCAKTFRDNDTSGLYIVSKAIRVLTLNGAKHSIMHSFIGLGMTIKIFKCLEFIDDAQRRGDSLSSIKNSLKRFLQQGGHSFLCILH